MEHSRGPKRGLIERDDSILLIIDFQDRFLAKMDEARAAHIVDRGRFVLDVALGLAIPRFVTVEDPAANGPTTAALRALLEGDAPEHDKQVFGLCGQPDLFEAIQAQSRRTAILIGLETDVCVLHSSVGLLQNGFRAVIVGDATGAPGDEHDLGLARAQALGVELVHAKGLFYEWIRSLADLRALRDRRTIAAPIGTVL